MSYHQNDLRCQQHQTWQLLTRKASVNVARSCQMGESKTSPPASSNRQEYNPSYNYAPYFIITPCHGHDDTNLSRSATQHQYHSTPPFTKPYEEPNLKSDWIGNAKTTRTKIFAIHRTSQMSTRRCVLSKRITDRTHLTIDPVLLCTLLQHTCLLMQFNAHQMSVSYPKELRIGLTLQLTRCCCVPPPINRRVY